MLNEFLKAMNGENEVIDPLETIIPKHLIGVRDYAGYFKVGVGIGVFLLVITLSEVHPIFSQLIYGFYLSFIVFFMMDITKEQKEEGSITRGKFVMYIAFYLIVLFLSSMLINLIKGI